MGFLVVGFRVVGFLVGDLVGDLVGASVPSVGKFVGILVVSPPVVGNSVKKFDGYGVLWQNLLRRMIGE